MSRYEDMLEEFDRLDDQHHGWDDDGELFDDEALCTHCGGEGLQEGDRPGWDLPGELVDCRSCNGSGMRRDQRVF